MNAGPAQLCPNYGQLRGNAWRMIVDISRKWRVLPCAGFLAVLAGMSSSFAASGQADQDLKPAAAQSEASGPPAPPAPSFSLVDRERRLGEKGLVAGSPVLIRIFKGESELELWLQKDGRFELFSTYRICFWSGVLGPKLREGDKQAPEGIYSVGPEQLHLKGRQPRSLDLGFPNALDRAHARTGSYILVHGGCRSIGCYAMTNPVMEEIFALSEHALRQGQARIQVQAFPFRLTEENLRLFASHPWHGFWLNLKQAYDAFEETRAPPRVAACQKKYVVAASNAGAEAHQAIAICEKGEAEAALWQLPGAETANVHVPRVRYSAAKWRGRRAAGRNTRKAYAAARRARVAAYARRNDQ